MIPLFSLEAKISSYRDKIESSFGKTISSGNVILGDNVELFEKEFASFVGTNHCVSVANGTDALRIALLALGLNRDSKIGTVANAGFYSTTAILSIGATPLFIDVEYSSRHLTFEVFTDFVTRNQIHAIVLTHLYGAAITEIEKIVNYCKVSGIRIIEDCAQSHGAKVNNRRTGSFAEIATFSFYPTKNLGALGDAGAIVTDSPELAERVRSLRTYGWKNKYEVNLDNGTNSRMDEIQAGFLNVFLTGLEKDNIRRRQIALTYNSILTDHPLIGIPIINSLEYVGHLYVISTPKRNQHAAYLTEAGIQTAIHYPIPDHKQRIIESSVQLPITERLSSEVLTIPCRPDLTDGQVSFITEVLKNI